MRLTYSLFTVRYDFTSLELSMCISVNEYYSIPAWQDLFVNVHRYLVYNVNKKYFRVLRWKQSVVYIFVGESALYFKVREQ